MKKNKSLLIEIDFLRPWWHVIWTQKWLLLLVTIEEIIANVFETLIPIIFMLLFSYQRYDYFIYFSLIWLLIIVGQDSIRKINGTLELRCIHSVHFNAHKKLLTVDPMYHAHKDSGAILSKIDRCARSFEMIIDALFIDILGYVTGIITALISLMQESMLLSVILCLLLIAISILNMKLARLFIIPKERKFIEADDKTKSLSQENLSQINFIRSYFASNEINQQLIDGDNNLIRQEGNLWNANISMWTSIKLMYLLTVFIVSLYLIRAVIAGTLTPLNGVSLMVMYIQGTYGIISLERPMRVVLRSLTRIKDLYNFIPNFGKKTFPVLQEDSKTIPLFEKPELLSIECNHIGFAYSNHIHIFDDHNLAITIPKEATPKLFGVIGPSGIGKSTLLSILGGQLRPQRGSILINAIDIYKVDDITRRSLIALQGQTATSFRGTLKHNLLFGLTDKHVSCDDAQLINILTRVGLWNMFRAKDGLSTNIGEGGMTLSGGQRQRLNFASLYLRACHYKPSVILIDEPTSSLDEMSEQAITSMIVQLAQDAITIVIAHRIKTIQHAMGVLDFSLLKDEKNIQFYSHQQLLKKSAYYQHLITGIIEIE